MALKKSSRKITTLKSLTIEASKELINSQANTIDLILFCSTNGQDEYSLGPIYKTTNDNIAFPFDRSADMFFIKKTKVSLSIWFESRKPLIT